MTINPLPARMDALTSVRFFAAFWVLILHITNHVHLPGLSGSHVIENGDFGVDLFFILSGFILCHVYLKAVEEKRFSAIGFLWARFARIYPLHALTTTIAIGMAILYGDGLWGRWIVANYTMTHSWGFFDGPYGLNGPSWSVSAEWMAYIGFGLFAAASVAMRARPVLFVAMAAALIAAVQAYLDAAGLGDLSDQWYATTVLRIGPEFLFGCALHGLARATVLSRRLADLGVAVSVVGALVLATIGSFDVVEVWLLGAVIFFLAQRERHDAPTFMRDRRLVWLGESSYSLYLVHDLVLSAVYAGAPDGPSEARAALDGTLLIALIGVAAATWASYALVERPARDALRRIGPPGRAWLRALAPKSS